MGAQGKVSDGGQLVLGSSEMLPWWQTWAGQIAGEIILDVKDFKMTGIYQVKGFKKVWACFKASKVCSLPHESVCWKYLFPKKTLKIWNTPCVLQMRRLTLKKLSLVRMKRGVQCTSQVHHSITAGGGNIWRDRRVTSLKRRWFWIRCKVLLMFHTFKFRLLIKDLYKSNNKKEAPSLFPLFWLL